MYSCVVVIVAGHGVVVVVVVVVDVVVCKMLFLLSAKVQLFSKQLRLLLWLAMEDFCRWHGCNLTTDIT